MTRPSSRSSSVALIAGVLVLLAFGTPLAAQTALPFGTVVRGTLPDGGTVDYPLTVPTAGVLSVASDGTGDLQLQLLDADGQPVANGQADGDLDRVGARERLAVRVGEAGAYRLDAALDPAAGDERDWYVIRAATAGTLVFATRSPGEGDDGFDLVLEVFLDGKFDEAAHRSDQDLQEDLANEAVTVVVQAGQTVHVRVSTLSPVGGRYRLSNTLME
jgi:hypothetical protein